MKLLNLGMDDPLSLNMTHPLAERVETLGHKTTNSSLSRGAISAMIVGGALLSAPLTLASNPNLYPQQSEELAGKAGDTDKAAVKIKRLIKIDGQSDGFEIEKHGDIVAAYKIDENGVKTQIDPSDIEGLDLSSLEGLKSLESLKWLENIEGRDNPKIMTFLSSAGKS